MKSKRIFESFFHSIRKDGRKLLGEEYASVAASIFNFAWKEINGEHDNSDYESDGSDDDLSEIFDSKLEDAIIYVEGVAELFKISTEAKNKFVLVFNEFAVNSERAIKSLEDLSKVVENTEGVLPVPDDSSWKKYFKSAWGSVKCIGWKSVSTLGTGLEDGIPVEKGKEISPANSHPRSVIETPDDAWLVEIHMNNGKESFSAMTDWFLLSEKLENGMNSLFHRNVSREMVQEMQIFTEEVADQTNMSDDEIKAKFLKVLRHCIGQMVKYSKIKKKFGTELAPAVMTYLIVVCLMSDENRSALGCSLLNQRMCFDLMTVLNLRALEDQLIDGVAAKGMSSLIASMSIRETLTWYRDAINLLSSTDASKSSNAPCQQKIRDVAEKLKKIVEIIGRARNETTAFNSQTNAVQQRSILVRQTPEGASHVDINMAVKPFVSEEAWDRIEILRIPTIENNWLVKVPENHALILLQQTKIYIGGKGCTVNQ